MLIANTMNFGIFISSALKSVKIGFKSMWFLLIIAVAFSVPIKVQNLQNFVGLICSYFFGLQRTIEIACFLRRSFFPIFFQQLGKVIWYLGNILSTTEQSYSVFEQRFACTAVLRQGLVGCRQNFCRFCKHKQVFWSNLHFSKLVWANLHLPKS